MDESVTSSIKDADNSYRSYVIPLKITPNPFSQFMVSVENKNYENSNNNTISTDDVDFKLPPKYVFHKPNKVNNY